MKTCLNCGRYGFASYDINHKWPMCETAEDESVDLFEEELLIDRETIEPGGDCNWIPRS